jgi:MYXO-CTERM domain-containing protein
MPVAVGRTAVTTGPSLSQGEVAVVLNLIQPLSPATEYEVVDRRPNIPCGPSSPMTCALGAVTVVGAFTSGAGPSNDAPAAPMGGSLIEGMFSHCNSSACCGPYLVKRFEARWEAAAAGTRLYNVYAGTPEMPPVRLLDGNGVNLAVSCAGGGGDPGALWVTPGSVRVRAVDHAGNESPTIELGAIPANVCADAPTNGVDFPPEAPRIDAAIDAHDASVDAGIDAAPDAALDAALAAPDARADGAASGSDVAPPPPRTTSGGGCQVGGSPGAAVSLMPLALLAAAALLRRRRR